MQSTLIMHVHCILIDWKVYVAYGCWRCGKKKECRKEKGLYSPRCRREILKMNNCVNAWYATFNRCGDTSALWRQNVKRGSEALLKTEISCLS